VDREIHIARARLIGATAWAWRNPQRSLFHRLFPCGIVETKRHQEPRRRTGSVVGACKLLRGLLLGGCKRKSTAASSLAPVWLSSDARPELWALLGGSGYDCTYVSFKLLALAVRKGVMARRGVMPSNAGAVGDFGSVIIYVGPPAAPNVADLSRVCSNGQLTWLYPGGLGLLQTPLS